MIETSQRKLNFVQILKFVWIEELFDRLSEISHITDEESSKLQNNLNYNRCIKIFQDKLRKSSEMFNECWQLLEEENPQIQKVKACLLSATKLNKNVNEYWNKYTYYFKRSPKTMISFGFYNRAVLNDVYKSQELIQLAAKSLRKINKKRLNFNDLNLETNLSWFPDPVAIFKKTTVNYY